MNTEENNRLIAKFMNLPYFLSDSGVDSWGDDDVERWEVGIDHYCKINELQYHIDWSWLMPVVEKIVNSTPAPFPNTGLSSIEDKIAKGRIFQALSTVNITYVYQAVIEFINWYNEQEESK